MEFDNLSLIGFMGSGKSTIGKLLADKLGFLFIDIDRIIELRENESISKIFGTKGENFFRDVETEVIKKLYKNKKCVFACGGGSIIRKENYDVIINNSTVIYLEVSSREILKRIGGEKDRPLLNSGNKIKKVETLLKKRKKIYQKRSDIIINTNMKSKKEVLGSILERLK